MIDNHCTLPFAQGDQYDVAFVLEGPNIGFRLKYVSKLGRIVRAIRATKSQDTAIYTLASTYHCCQQWLILPSASKHSCYTVVSIHTYDGKVHKPPSLSPVCFKYYILRVAKDKRLLTFFNLKGFLL